MTAIIHAYLYDWGEPITDGSLPFEYVWDLYNPKSLQNLTILFGNGIIGEMRAEANSEIALLVLYKLMRSVGGCVPHELSESEKSSLHLYQAGDECYLQEQAGDPVPGYIFINLQLNPNLTSPSPHTEIHTPPSVP